MTAKRLTRLAGTKRSFFVMECRGSPCSGNRALCRETERLTSPEAIRRRSYRATICLAAACPLSSRVPRCSMREIAVTHSADHLPTSLTACPITGHLAVAGPDLAHLPLIPPCSKTAALAPGSHRVQCRPIATENMFSYTVRDIAGCPRGWALGGSRIAEDSNKLVSPGRPSRS